MVARDFLTGSLICADDHAVPLSSAHQGSRTKGADVSLINNDGMAFIGPGSEWFWTALSGVVLAITFLGIYRQLSLARSANAFEQMSRIANEWDSERLARHKLEILLALPAGVKPEHVPDGAAGIIRDFWDDVAALVRAGHIEQRLVYETLRAPCRGWWVTLAPYTRRLRVEDSDPGLSEHFEWLAGLMAGMERKAGITSHYADEAVLASSLGWRIERTRGEIRVAEELRTVIVRPMSPPLLDPTPTEPQEPSAT